MKNIVFIPDAYYLSDPIYMRLSNSKLSDANYIYFDTKFPLSFEQTSLGPQHYLKTFDKFDEISLDSELQIISNYFSNKKILYRLLSVVKFVKAYRIYQSLLEIKLDKMQPSVIIVTTDKLLVSREIFNYAQKHHIPYIVYQSAFISDNKYPVKRKIKNLAYRLIFNKLLRIPLGTLNSLYGNEHNESILFLWGIYFRDKFYKGKKKDHMQIVGNPLYDEIFQSSQVKTKQLENTLPVKCLKILICTQEMTGLITEKEAYDLKISYKKLIEDNPQHTFCIKIHPRESETEYTQLFKDQIFNNVIIKNKVNLIDLFHEYHIQISTGSLTSFMAIVAGLPVILFKPDMLKTSKYFDGQVEERVDTVSEMTSIIKKINGQSYYSNYLIRRDSYLDKMLSNDSVNNFNRIINEIQ